MTGPEHFRDAEEALREAHDRLGLERYEGAAAYAAVAQAHAALASVALGARGPDRDREAWREAAGD
jgi:hypothetical protein